ncbi:Odorant receptor 49b [Carabus blaptoides fortunei]
MGCLKGMIFIMNKKSIRTFLKSFEEGVFIPDTTRGGEREINIIKSAISVATMQANAFYLMAGAAITNRVVYACRDSATIEYIYDPVTNTTMTSRERTLPWYSWFWFDTRPTPNYQIAFFYQVWCVSLFGVEIGVLDTLISAMLVHLNAQFSILNNAIVTVTERARRMQIEEQETDQSTNNDIINNNIAVITHSSHKILEDGWEQIPKNDPVLSKYLDTSVSSCLAHHLKIIELSDNVEDQFNLMLLVQVLGSSLMFCFQLFQLSQMHLFSMTFMNMTAYFVLMLFQLSIYCYNGNEISMQSEQISAAAYNTDWFGAEDSVKKNLILMMVRAQRPIKISAGKFVFLSLATFMNIHNIPDRQFPSNSPSGLQCYPAEITVGTWGVKTLPFRLCRETQ